MHSTTTDCEECREWAEWAWSTTIAPAPSTAAKIMAENESLYEAYTDEAIERVIAEQPLSTALLQIAVWLDGCDKAANLVVIAGEATVQSRIREAAMIVAEREEEDGIA